MACWHVGPCGVGCDGYTVNPPPQPAAPPVYPYPPYPMPSHPDKESAALEGWAGALKEVNRLNEELRLKDLQNSELQTKNDNQKSLVVMVREERDEAQRRLDEIAKLYGLWNGNDIDAGTLVQRLVPLLSKTEKRNHEHGPHGPVEGPGSPNE